MTTQVCEQEAYKTGEYDEIDEKVCIRARERKIQNSLYKILPDLTQQALNYEQCMSECEKSCGGSDTLRASTSAFVAGTTSGPVFATMAARRDANSCCRPGMDGCSPQAAPSAVSGWMGSSADCGTARF